MALAPVAAVILVAAARPAVGDAMWTKFKVILKHLWLDASDTRRAIPPEMLQRLTEKVAASERLHSGQIRIYVEGALPLSYLWRLSRELSLQQLIRQRAVMLFGKLRMWDTEDNNGVLIYLQLAEQAIEIVADRGVDRRMRVEQWQDIADQMSSAFKNRQFEDGLIGAINEVTRVLVAHFPSSADSQTLNELPDEPVLG